MLLGFLGSVSGAVVHLGRCRYDAVAHLARRPLPRPPAPSPPPAQDERDGLHAHSQTSGSVHGSRIRLEELQRC